MTEMEIVESAIKSARRGASGAAAYCFADIPPNMLAKAIKVFAAEAAGEQALAVVPSESSGKSGFVLTDKALYFRAVLEPGRARLPYDSIIEFELTKSMLRIATRDASIRWQLTSGVYLWERSRKRAAHFVGTVVEDVHQKVETKVEVAGSGAIPADAPPTATSGANTQPGFASGAIGVAAALVFLFFNASKIHDIGTFFIISFGAVFLGILSGQSLGWVWRSEPNLDDKRPQSAPSPQMNGVLSADQDSSIDPAAIGKCPNCAAQIPLASAVCPKCHAQFGAGSAWTVLKG